MISKNHIARTVENYAFDESLVGRHMVFIAGPRQVGKTMLAKHRLKQEHCESLYYNWDDIVTRQTWYKDKRFYESAARSTGIKDPLIVFDEIHKRNHWRSMLKGTYDLFGEEFRFLITGSARLDLFRHSGDSLVGRYSMFHLLPFSLREITGNPDPSCFLKENNIENLAREFEASVSGSICSEISDACESLKNYGPFPEPWLKQNERFCRKWHLDYSSLMIRQDLRDISRVVELDKIENLFMLMSERIMAPLSMSNLSGELEVAHTTIKNWLEQLKRLYLVFQVPPWSKKVTRGLKKEKKWYYMDWYYAPEGAARIENMLATCLYRTCLAMTDMGYGTYTLHYVRTLDKKEIDFLIARDRKPLFAVEVKTADTGLSGTLKNRAKWFPDTATIGVQVVDQRNVFQKYPDNTWIMSIERLLNALI